MGTASSTLHPVLPKPGSLLAIGGAAVILAAAIALKLVIDHLVGEQIPPFLVLWPAVIAIGFLAGPRTGFAAACVVSMVAIYAWLPPVGRFALEDAGEVVTAALFTLLGGGVGWCMGQTRLMMERVRAAELEREIAAREAVHRIRNLVAVIQAVRRRVAKEADTKEAFSEMLGAKIDALGAAQTVLLRRNWTDADLAEVVHAAVAPFTCNRDLHVDAGPHVRVPAAQVGSLCMALYELCTNSMKYGALARGGGVTLGWAVVDGEAILSWDEFAPGLVEGAESSGLGTLLIRSALGGAPGASVYYVVDPRRVQAVFRWQAEGPPVRPVG